MPMVNQPPAAGPRPAAAAPDGAALFAKLSPEAKAQFMAAGVTPGPAGAASVLTAGPSPAPRLPHNVPAQGVPMTGAGFVRREGAATAGPDARAAEKLQTQRLALMKLGLGPKPHAAGQVKAAPPPAVAPAVSPSTPGGPAPDFAPMPAVEPQQTWFDQMNNDYSGWLSAPPDGCLAWLKARGVDPIHAAGHAAWLDAYATSRTGQRRAYVVPVRPAGQVAAPGAPLGQTLAIAAVLAAVVGGGAFLYGQTAGAK